MLSIEGKSLGHYQILSQVDEGGMATIFKAFDTHLERYVAIKIIRKESFSPNILELVLKRFEREAKSLAQLSHPNIVKVMDYGEFENSPYLVLEFLSGGTLKQRLQGKVAHQEAVRWLIPMAQALAYAHHRGVIHRDVKPSNILFTETNEPMLSDFGIAKILETHTGDSLTGSGVGIGTPEYMAPEQGLGQQVDARTDIYSLGIVLYEILTGRRPFQADTPMAVVLKHVNEPVPSARMFDPNISVLADQILKKALAKNPEDRFTDMVSFCKALSQLISQYPEASGSPVPFIKDTDTLPVGSPGKAGPAETDLVPEEDTGKLLIRISRLEKVVEESLTAEDFEDAGNLISTIEGLGERGRQAATRLRANLELTRKKVRLRDADISNIKIAIPEALEAEDLPKADELMKQLQTLGAKGEALASQFQIAIDTARQQITLRQAEITRLKSLVEKSLLEENFSKAEALIMSLSVISGQGKVQAARLQETVEKARQQAGRRKGEIYRLSGQVESQLSEKNWEAARKTLKELDGLGAEGKMAADGLRKTLERAEKEIHLEETSAASYPVEKAQVAATPVAVTAVEATALERARAGKRLEDHQRLEEHKLIESKRKSSPLPWLTIGAAALGLVLLVGAGLAIRSLTQPRATKEANQAGETIQAQAPLVTRTESLPLPTETLPEVLTTIAPSPLPQETVAPTQAPAATHTPAATFTHTPTPQSFFITIISDYANVRAGPGTVYGIIASKTKDTVLEAVGRNEQGDWFVVKLPDGQIGWLSGKTLYGAFDPYLLPVVQAPPTPKVPTKRPTDKSSDSPSNPPTWTPPPP